MEWRLGQNFVNMKRLLTLLTVAGLFTSHALAGAIGKGSIEIPEQFRGPIKMLHKICVAESGASEDSLKKCIDGTIHDERGVKCYIHCLFDKVEVIEEGTGRILLDRLAPLAPSNEIKDALEHLTRECGHISHEDSCDTAYEVAKCYFAAHDDVIKFCHLLMADH